MRPSYEEPFGIVAQNSCEDVGPDQVVEKINEYMRDKWPDLWSWVDQKLKTEE